MVGRGTGSSSGEHVSLDAPHEGGLSGFGFRRPRAIDVAAVESDVELAERSHLLADRASGFLRDESHAPFTGDAHAAAPFLSESEVLKRFSMRSF